MKKLRVVVSLITDDNDYQREQAAAASEAAVRLDVDVQTLFADNDSYQSEPAAIEDYPDGAYGC